MDDGAGCFAVVGIILLFLLVLFGLILLSGIRFSSTTQGIHSVYVTAIQQDGYLFPNYKIYVKTDNSSSQEDTYCVNRNNTRLADLLKKYNIAKTRVTIAYKGVRGWGYDLCQGQEIVGVQEDK